MFVALLLAAVLAARAGDGPSLAGRLLGLACATKQLAWPFAPFLLLALSGAGQLPRPGRRAASCGAPAGRGRGRAPSSSSSSLPVAALDSRAFYGDIVVYNVGLPGADNYPLGGTPGLRLRELPHLLRRACAACATTSRSAASTSCSSPSASLLLRAQLRDGHPEAALSLTGSAALLASLYFSRVVHPNYLIPAAVLLPLAVLARRGGADLAVVPLLLLALGSRSRRTVFSRRPGTRRRPSPGRSGGEASRRRSPRRRARALTKDPLGLLWSATAAGLGVLYLALAVGGAPRRARLAVTALAGVLVVGAPALVLASLSARTGIVRAQDPAVVQAQADASRLLAGRSPYSPPPEASPRGREAWSASFRLDPPAEILPARPLLPPGPSQLVGLARVAGVRDLRLVALLALAALAAVAALRFEGRRRRTALALALLAAPLATGTVLGSPAALPLAALVGAWAAGRRWALAGALAGAAVALDHRALLVAPFLLARVAPGERRRAAIRAAAAYGLLVAPVVLLDPAAFAARLGAEGVPGPGLGLFNLLAYRGVEASAGALALAALAPLLSAGVVLWLLTRPGPPLARGAVAGLVGLVLAPAVSAEAVALPLVLLGLAAITPADGEPAEAETATRAQASAL